VRILFAPEAEADLHNLMEYLAGQNPRAASQRGEHILSTIEQLADGEFEGPEQTLLSGEAVRSWAVPPLRIYYQREAGTLRVLRIYHQARRPIVR
jgi:plasmid stabilization system protein ParE